MKPLTDTQKRLISKNVLAACRDITKLNKTGYNFLYLCNGFIAHYDIHGFKAHYSEHSLVDELAIHAHANQWHNFRAGERDADYYHSKRDAYNMILGGLVARQALNEQFDDAMRFLRDHVRVIHVK